MKANRLTKEFVVPFTSCDGVQTSINREMYETMPMPLAAHKFSDEQMQTLAENIASELCIYNFDIESPYYEDEVDDAFWKEAELCAVHMGMQYYDDL